MNRAGELASATAAVVAAWGTLFSAVEHAGLVAGLYWAVETATTVGYGDVTPHDTTGRLLAVGAMLTAIPLLAATFSEIHLGRVKAHVDKRLREHLGKPSS